MKSSREIRKAEQKRRRIVDRRLKLIKRDPLTWWNETLLSDLEKNASDDDHNC